MAKVFFSSLNDCDLVEVDFITTAGNRITRTLFVDSGFTGQSSFILSDQDTNIIHSRTTSAQAMGALQGTQDRGVVYCEIPAISFQSPMVAIRADLAQLSLPSTLQGMAGLSFLRCFDSWGAEKLTDGSWRFFLSQQ